MKHIIIPMAGEGQRFKNNGYKLSKPSLPIPNVFRNGKSTSMIIGAIDSMLNIYKTENIHLVHRDFHVSEGVIPEIKIELPNIKTYELNKLSEGQAISCGIATNKISENDEILVGACDSGFVLDKSKFEHSTKNSDVVVFAFKNNPIVELNPNAYGWIHVDNNEIVKGISVKKPISNNPINDYAVCGTFWFKSVGVYNKLLNKMVEKNIRVNNEFYIDELINIYLNEGLKVSLVKVDMLFCWGTPKDYEDYRMTYKYWKEFLNQEK